MKGFARLLILVALALQAPFVLAEEIPLELLTKAQTGDAEAQCKLGVFYAAQKDIAAALKWFREAANKGNHDAEFYLGRAYRTGDGVTKDGAAAIEWFTSASGHGKGGAEDNLADMYYHGDGVSKDVAEAIKWYFKAANEGSAGAQDSLGNMYFKGDGVPKDDTKAVEWWTKAADHGVADAQNNLGLMYEDGAGVKEDDAEAVKWCRKAAEQGDAYGQENLGRMYRDGIGIKKDDAEALALYRKAAEQGNVDARQNFGRMWAGDINLTDGRVFHDAKIVSESSSTVTIRFSGGLSSVEKTLLPEKLATIYTVDATAIAEATEKEPAEERDKGFKGNTRNADDSSWHQIINFSGDGATKTERFTISGKDWRIRYSFSNNNSNVSGAILQVFAYGTKDMLLVNTDKEGSDICYGHDPGTYYLDISSLTCHWEIDVEELR